MVEIIKAIGELPKEVIGGISITLIVLTYMVFDGIRSIVAAKNEANDDDE